jgi:hypothetical protein
MIVMKKALPRRTFLRGMGAALSLPLLDAMVPAMTALAATPANPARRLGFVYIPMGSHIKEWTPRSEGNLAELSPSLRPLLPVVDHLTVVTNTELKNAYPGTHATSNAAFLSAATSKWTESSDYELATTVDQIAAQRIGRDTRLPSLELAMDLMTVIGQCDNGYACVYQNNLSWSSPTTPLPAEAHPRIVFERLFGDGGSSAERNAELHKTASLLDWVSEDIARLQKKLGPGDRTKVSQYLDTVRELERRIQKAEAQTADSHARSGLPVGAFPSRTPITLLMFDLQVLAMVGDVTRDNVQLARPATARTRKSALSSPTTLTHNGGNPRNWRRWRRSTRFTCRCSRITCKTEGHAGRRRLAARSFHDSLRQWGNRITRSLICQSSWPRPQPAQGRPPRQYAEPQPLANLHLTLLDRRSEADRFADSNGEVKELPEPPRCDEDLPQQSAL